MSRMLLFATIFIQLMTSYAWAHEQAVNSKIEQVTVFTQGAQVFRTATVKLSPGEHQVIFPGLTAHLNGQSIQVGGRGDLTILAVSHRINYLDVPGKSEKEKALTDQLDQLNADLEHARAMYQVYQEEENLILTNKNLGGQQTGVSIDQLQQAADFYRTRLAEIKTKKLELTAEQNRLKEEYTKVNNALRQVTNSRGISTAEVVVKVDVKTSTTAKFNFNYVVNNASWQPYYDIRLDDLSKPIRLAYKAKVTQSTGVDWTNILITLSSGNPNKNNVLPAVSPWYIDFLQGSMRGARAEVQGYYQATADDAEALDEVVVTAGNGKYRDKRMMSPSFVVNQKVTNFEYAIANRYTIKSSNVAEDVSVRTVEVDALFEYRANIKRDETAYLMAKITNWHNYNLLNGQAKLFNQGTFVGETFLDVESTKDTLFLSMGRDENIVIKRERLVDMNGSQVIGDKKKMTRYWTVSVRNGKTQPISLVVTDQIPVSRQKQIAVKLEESSEANYQPDSGYLTWRLQLRPASSKDWSFGYSVKYPNDAQISFSD